MAANAVREAAKRAGLGPNDVELLTAATTGPDMLAPGHASMVHGGIGLRADGDFDFRRNL